LDTPTLLGGIPDIVLFCRVRIYNEAKAISITLLSARLVDFGIQSENIYEIISFLLMLTTFTGITLEYEQSGAVKSKTIDLLDLKAK